MSIDFLLDNEEDVSSTFDDDEMKLIYGCRDLDGVGRDLLFGILKLLRLSHAKKNTENKSGTIHSNRNENNYLTVSGSRYLNAVI